MENVSTTSENKLRLAKLLRLEVLLGRLNELLIADDVTLALVLCPEQLRVLLSELSVLGDLSWRLRQVGSLRLEASLVGNVGHLVGVAVVTDELEAALLLQSASLRLRSRLDAAQFLHL